jgi:hypothetical protein
MKKTSRDRDVQDQEDIPSCLVVWTTIDVLYNNYIQPNAAKDTVTVSTGFIWTERFGGEI